MPAPVAATPPAGPDRRILLAYGLPGLPLAALLLPLYVTLPTYYARDLGLGFVQVGIVLFAARLWDMLTDPLIGLLSDRTRAAFGRRRLWMLAGTPPTMVSAGFLFLPGPEASLAGLLGWSLLLYLGTSMLLLPYTAWGAELSGDYHERSRISGARESMIVAGTILAAAVPAFAGADPAAGLAAMAWIVWIVLPVCVLAALLLVPDRPVRQAVPLSRPAGMRAIYRNGPFRRLLTAGFLNGVANGLPATLFLLYVEFVLEKADWTGILLLAYFLSAIAGVPFWLRASRRLGKHRVWAGSMVGAAVIFAGVPLLGPGDHGLFLLVCILTGACLGADLVLPPAMQADVVDLDRLRSREQRAGAFFALWNLATKLALALAAGIAFPLLHLAGLKADVPPDSARTTLALLYSLLPALIKLAAVARIAGYPLTGARQRRLRQLIETREGRTARPPGNAA